MVFQKITSLSIADGGFCAMENRENNTNVSTS
jgi:hypothetical protein